MATAPDVNGIPRVDENDAGPDGTFSGLLNLILGWVSAAITLPPVAWTNVTGFAAGWSGYTGFGWSGLKATHRRGQSTITGAVSKSSAWAANDRILTITDPLYIPAVPIQSGGASVQLRTNGDLIVLTAGSGAISFELNYPS